jgi:drug/metabolite transporter (DMT)-like permease
VKRATGIGVTAGLLALLLWPLYAAYQEAVLWPFAAALAVTAVCGASILLITGLDMLFVKRGSSLRPVRAFDVAIGALLTVMPAIELRALWDQLVG